MHQPPLGRSRRGSARASAVPGARARGTGSARQAEASPSIDQPLSAAPDRRYRALFEHMSSGFAVCEPIYEYGRAVDFVVLDVNPAFETQTGLSRASVLGKRVTEALPGSFSGRARAIEVIGDVARTGEAVRFEVYSEPLQRWFSLFCYGPERGLCAIVFDDQTATRLAQAEHERARRRAEALAELVTALNHGREVDEVLRTAVEAATKALRGDDGVLFLIDDDGQGFVGALELRERGRKNHRFDLAGSLAAERAIRQRKPAWLTRENASGTELAWLHRLGIAGALASPLIASGECLGLLVVDFIEPAQAPGAEELDFAAAVASHCAIAIERADAFRASKVEAEVRERFFSVIGHDLRNPLGVVTMTVSNLLRRGGLTETQLRKLELVAQSADEMESILRRLLDSTRCRTGRTTAATGPEHSWSNP